MGIIYFVRHGESLWNVEKRICGSIDIPLTDRGRAMAKETGEIIKKQGLVIHRVLSSPLSRARETAEIISSIIGIRVEVEPRLTEQNFGEWEGRKDFNKDEFVNAKKSFALSYNGGESMMKTAQRVYNLLDEIKEDASRNYLLVAHNGISRFIQSYFFDMTNDEFASFCVPNCSITEYII